MLFNALALPVLFFYFATVELSPAVLYTVVACKMLLTVLCWQEQRVTQRIISSLLLCLMQERENL